MIHKTAYILAYDMLRRKGGMIGWSVGLVG